MSRIFQILSVCGFVRCVFQLGDCGSRATQCFLLSSSRSISFSSHLTISSSYLCSQKVCYLIISMPKCAARRFISIYAAPPRFHLDFRKSSRHASHLCHRLALFSLQIIEAARRRNKQEPERACKRWCGGET